MRRLALLSLALSGCSLLPDYVGGEHAHYSHITASRQDEDSLDTLQGYARWTFGEQEQCSTKFAIGARLRDHGFYGPTEVSSLTTGCEFKLSRSK